MSKIMTAEEWIKKFHPNTETFNAARLEIELKAYAQYYHSQMTAPQDVEKAIEKRYFLVDPNDFGAYESNVIRKRERQAAHFGYSLHQEKDKWISVEKRLPENEERVLALVNDVVRFCKFKDGNFQRETENSGNDRIITFYWNNVSHWQPLPLPPVQK